MALLADIIQGKTEKYLVSPTAIKETEYFRYDEASQKMIRKKPKAVESDNYAAWKETKRIVSTLPTDYLEILKKKAVEGGVEKRLLSKGCEFTVKAKYNGFPVELYVVELSTGLIKRAEYIAYNNQKNTVYVRSLLSGEAYSDVLAQF